jgi:hypothetical protein
MPQRPGRLVLFLRETSVPARSRRELVAVTAEKTRNRRIRDAKMQVDIGNPAGSDKPCAHQAQVWPPQRMQEVMQQRQQ